MQAFALRPETAVLVIPALDHTHTSSRGFHSLPYPVVGISNCAGESGPTRNHLILLCSRGGAECADIGTKHRSAGTTVCDIASPRWPGG
jgi:hypothetical protein